MATILPPRAARPRKTAAATVRAVAAASRRRPLEYVAPMKPVLVTALPTDTDHWLYEIKFDGFRVIALKTGTAVELWSSTQKPLDFPGVAAAIASLPCTDGIFDGEIVAADADGRSSFQLLQNSRDAEATAHVCVYLFDLLRLENQDLRGQTTVQRKARLAALVAKATPDDRLRFSADLQGEPAGILEAVKRLGLEGIVAKARSATYQAGSKGPHWQKFKIVAEQDFVIGGYTAPEGSRRHFGALLIGCYRDGRLHYVARVGTGFTAAALEKYHRQFQPLRRPECPFVDLPASQSGRWGQGITASKMRLCTWVRPTLVCRVRFAEWTTDGALRHPVFIGLRDDKTARQVVREPVPA